MKYRRSRYRSAPSPRWRTLGPGPTGVSGRGIALDLADVDDCYFIQTVAIVTVRVRHDERRGITEPTDIQQFTQTQLAVLQNGADIDTVNWEHLDAHVGNVTHKHVTTPINGDAPGRHFLVHAGYLPHGAPLHLARAHVVGADAASHLLVKGGREVRRYQQLFPTVSFYTTHATDPVVLQSAHFGVGYGWWR